MSKADDLIQYLKALGEMSSKIAPKDSLYASLEDLTLKEGRLFDSTPFTDAELNELKELLSRGDYKLGQCYRNAMSIALDYHGDMLQYAEGFAKGSAIIPVHHAWLVFKGKAVDVTWRKMKNLRIVPETLLARIKRNQAEAAYFGYTVPHDYLGKHIMATLAYSPVAEGTRYDFLPMRKGLPWKAGGQV